MNIIKTLNPVLEKMQEVLLQLLGERINDILQGGLGNGDFGLIFGNPGGGKSWSLVALGGFAVRAGYNVLHYTLELGEQYVGRRYDAFFSKIPVDQVLQNRDKIEEIIPEILVN